MIKTPFLSSLNVLINQAERSGEATVGRGQRRRQKGFSSEENSEASDQHTHLISGNAGQLSLICPLSYGLMRFAIGKRRLEIELISANSGYTPAVASFRRVMYLAVLLENNVRRKLRQECIGPNRESDLP